MQDRGKGDIKWPLGRSYSWKAQGQNEVPYAGLGETRGRVAVFQAEGKWV